MTPTIRSLLFVYTVIYQTRNSLMFSPDADVSPYHPKTMNSAEATGDPKSIKHSSTRLPGQEESPSSSRAMSAPPSPTRSRINAAISGTPCKQSIPYLMYNILTRVITDRPRSPTSNNFSLVPNIPSPTASELGPAAVKQLMTWGTLNATPRIISQSDDPAQDLPPPGTPFHLPAISSREAISHKLSHNASKSLRAKAGLLGLGPSGRTSGISRTPLSVGGPKPGSMAPPSWTPRRSDAVGNLTPAARRLLNRSTMGTAAARRADAMGKMAGWEGTAKGKEKDLNRVRWTPTPSPVTRRG